jgi:CRP/FNR family transcriptional regulator, cyclic AMP receptor protein
VVEISFLKNVPLFKGLPENKLEKIRQIIEFEDCLAEQELIRDGDCGDTMFILLEGEVSVSKKLTLLPEEYQSNHRNKVLLKLSAASHAVFGEMALFEENSERSATVTTLTTCKVGIIKKNLFLKLTSEDRELGYFVFKNISEILSDRLKKANKDIVKLTTALSLALGE